MKEFAFFKRKAKRIIILLSAVILIIVLFRLCGNISGSTGEPDYKTNIYGEKSIHVLGDSISHGANASYIPSQSYVGLLKISLSRYYGGCNYGYTSSKYYLSNNSGSYEELHRVVYNDAEWTSSQSSLHPGSYIITSNGKTAPLQYTLGMPDDKSQHSIKAFTVYYEEGSNMGDFEIRANGRPCSVVHCTSSSPNPWARTEIFKVPDSEDALHDITITPMNESPVVIAGVGYYENPEYLTVNNYSLSGLKLTDLSDETIVNVSKCGLLIMALGHNDAGQKSDPELFTSKIDLIIESCREYGTPVIVLDTIWDLSAENNFYRSELRRLSETLSGIYMPLSEKLSVENGLIEDGSHPTEEGHRLIAQELCKAMGIGIAGN